MCLCVCVRCVFVGKQMEGVCYSVYKDRAIAFVMAYIQLHLVDLIMAAAAAVVD